MISISERFLVAKEEITAVQKEKIQASTVSEIDSSSLKSAIVNDKRNNGTIEESENVSLVETKGMNYIYWIIL